VLKFVRQRLASLPKDSVPCQLPDAAAEADSRLCNKYGIAKAMP